MAVGTVLILVALDMFSKSMADRYLVDGLIVEIIPGFFNLQWDSNTGAAWNLLAEHSWGTAALAVVSLAVSVVVLYYLQRCRGFKAKLVLVLIAAGGIGNLVDRVRLGRVTDFLSFIFGSYRFPTFNLADSFVTVGVILAIIFLLIDRDFSFELAGCCPPGKGDNE